MSPAFAFAPLLLICALGESGKVGSLYAAIASTAVQALLSGAMHSVQRTLIVLHRSLRTWILAIVAAKMEQAIMVVRESSEMIL